PSDRLAFFLRRRRHMSTERLETDTVAFTVGDGIAWVRFNRPEKRNCMSPKLNRQMMRVLDELEYRVDAGVLVLSGEGSAWSAGMDLKEYFRETEAQAFAAEDAQFGLSEINWGILPGGGASKVARELLTFRRAMYHALMGESIDGRTAAEWGLVNEALPRDALEERVTAVARALLQKNPVALKAAKDAIRRVGEMTYDNAEDYLVRAQEAANFFDNEGRKEGIHQFVDEKAFKPGLGAYDRSRRRSARDPE